MPIVDQPLTKSSVTCIMLLPCFLFSILLKSSGSLSLLCPRYVLRGHVPGLQLAHLARDWQQFCIQPELRKKPKPAPLDLQGNTIPPVWFLGQCPGMREEAEAPASLLVGNGWGPLLVDLLWLGTATTLLSGLWWDNGCLRATKTVCSQTPHSF